DIKVNPPWPVLYLFKWSSFEVVILGSDSFDVKTIDKKSLTLGPGKAKQLRYYITDVNNDGKKDYIATFKGKGTGLKKGKQDVCVCGTAGGEGFEGCDEIYVKPVSDKWHY
ncbi:hypothetical protein, partial [Photobacterium sp. OFAV2-7]|uniref:hypothetical protein n=1 Tax=Photobacterium sp. OFAV2-7 TaxID=2917748 RepID=UPI001EF4B442